MAKKTGRKKPRGRAAGLHDKPATPRSPFPVSVRQGDEEVPREILADAIVKIGEGFERLSKSGLNRRAIVVLVRDASGVTKGDVHKVLDALENLRGLYTS